MACRSGSVKRVADKTVAAKSEIEKLQAMIREQENDNKTRFFQNIDSHLADARVTDAREISYSSDIKTEYTSEFSLDKIAGVVTAALKALAESQKAEGASPPAISPGAIAAYTDVVNTVAEAAKSSSTASVSLSFSMNRLAPGLFAFLHASSVNIEDKETFGTEAVTSTAIYYRFMQSIDDVKNEAKYGLAVIAARGLLDAKKLQAGLMDRVASGEIDVDTWMKLDDQYSLMVKRWQDELDKIKFDSDKTFVLTAEEGFGAPVKHSFVTGSATDQKVVRTAIEKLRSEDADAYKVVIDRAETRLSSIYY